MSPVARVLRAAATSGAPVTMTLTGGITHTDAVVICWDADDVVIVKVAGERIGRAIAVEQIVAVHVPEAVPA